MRFAWFWRLQLRDQVPVYSPTNCGSFLSLSYFSFLEGTGALAEVLKSLQKCALCLRFLLSL